MAWGKGPLPGLTRRELAVGGGAILGVTGVTAMCALSRVATAPDEAAPDAAARVDEFLALSAILTNRTDLDARTGARLYAALDADNAAFAPQARALAAFARARGASGVEALAAAVDARNQTLAPVLHWIVMAWYLGIVGDGPAGQVIADERALMYDVVRDALAAPSYCGGAPGAWAIRPPPV